MCSQRFFFYIQETIRKPIVMCKGTIEDKNLLQIQSKSTKETYTLQK